MLLAIAFVTCFAGGVFPLVNADLFIVGAALLTPWRGAAALVVVAVVGQLAGKVIVFVAVRHARRRVMRLLGRRAIRLAVRARAGYSPGCRGRTAWKRNNGIMFLSASVGLPPFAATTLFAASTGVPLQHFVVAAGLGRTLRTVVIVLIPSVLVGG